VESYIFSAVTTSDVYIGTRIPPESYSGNAIATQRRLKITLSVLKSNWARQALDYEAPLYTAQALCIRQQRFQTLVTCCVRKFEVFCDDATSSVDRMVEALGGRIMIREC
jgi:hypothetical protein